jgi:uncharacterized Zn finger protein
MPIRPCPKCGEPTLRLIEAANQIAYVYYYRCEQCGHVWTIPKDNQNAPPTPITQEDTSKLQ